MISTVYTYRNKKVVLVQKPEFYFLKNEQDFDKLVDQLLDIDATSSPADLTFPCILRLKTGFAPTLVESSIEEYNKSLAQHQEMISQHEKHLLSYKNEVVKLAQDSIKLQKKIIKKHKD